MQRDFYKYNSVAVNTKPYQLKFFALHTMVLRTTTQPQRDQTPPRKGWLNGLAFKSVRRWNYQPPVLDRTFLTTFVVISHRLLPLKAPSSRTPQGSAFLGRCEKIVVLSAAAVACQGREVTLRTFKNVLSLAFKANEKQRKQNK